MDIVRSILSGPSLAPWTAQNLILAALFLLLAGVALRRFALPKLYPDIPHHPDANSGIFGDLPKLIEHAKQSGGQVLDWMSIQCNELDSSIVQLVLEPLSPPYIVVDDHATVEDILTKRTPREFDRAYKTKDMFDHVIPKSSLLMQSNNGFRSQRGMWSGTMSPAFLNTVAAPIIHASFNRLVDVWKRKAELAPGRPFEAGLDIRSSTLDAIYAIAQGNELGMVQSQLDFLDSPEAQDIDTDPESAAVFRRGTLPPLARAVDDLVGSITANNPFPRTRRLFLSLLPSFRRAWNFKDRSVQDMLDAAREKFAGNQKNVDDKVVSALDYVIRKEVATQEKTGQVAVSDEALKDETFMFILAGHETTSTAIQWTVKILADHPDIQQKLHDCLSATLPLDATASDILQADVPYLDAVIHEILRFSRMTGAIMREAVVDTQVLGYRIPKGACVMLCLQQDSFWLDETLNKPKLPKQEGYRALEQQWQTKGKRNFDPSRWLTDSDGKEAFNPNAGPSFPFSTGVRGCFGKRLALMELRMAVALLSRNLHFEPVPDPLNSYKARDVISRIPIQCYVKPVATE